MDRYILRITRLQANESSSIILKDNGDTIESNHSALELNVNDTSTNESKKLARWVPNVAFPSKSDYRSSVYAEVHGQFAHNKELSRVHNAICCVTRRFDLIVRGTGNSDDHEGRTSFGKLHFVQVDVSEKVLSDNLSQDIYFQHLENLPWVHFEILQGSKDELTMTRRKWVYADEYKVSENKGGPSWVIESRARCK